jgi:hypothetical protein
MASQPVRQLALLNDAPALAIATAPRRPECLDKMRAWADKPAQKRDELAVHTRIHLNYTAGLERDLKLAESDLRAAYRQIDALERQLAAAPDSDEVQRWRGKVRAARSPMWATLALGMFVALLVTLAVVL